MEKNINLRKYDDGSVSSKLVVILILSLTITDLIFPCLFELHHKLKLTIIFMKD